jgi:hypothetical protein
MAVWITNLSNWFSTSVPGRFSSKSMLANQSYPEVVSTQGEPAILELTITFSTLTKIRTPPRKCSPKLLACKGELRLIWRNAFLGLNLRLHIVGDVARLKVQGDGLLVRVLTKICMPPCTKCKVDSSKTWVSTPGW